MGTFGPHLQDLIITHSFPDVIVLTETKRSHKKAKAEPAVRKALALATRRTAQLRQKQPRKQE